ncbi:Aste57867_14703 [Aphanomyces stellatus]|uniref:Aste57867_14703 protein n=1 Tax=Aphanomyces stellatus TaxID=120398 RepID=A0A485L1D2_9STRA|nr:hypothetical protein As57867_014648 [Aphanomyces stellatus]VFT91521.1 Aste57867_14703 [Aphanomyces stellatus]
MRMQRLLAFGALMAASVISDTPSAPIMDPPVLPLVMGTVVSAYKPLLADFAKKSLPATVGNCSDANPPAPCLDMGYLLAQTSSLYAIKARWITGLNTISVGDINFSVDDKTGAATLDVVLGFVNLPLSLRIDACLGGACTTFSDGTSACCGGPKTFAMTATVACSESYPFLRNFTLTKIQIRPSIDLMFPVNGKPTSLFDVTKPVEAGLNATAAAFVQKQGLDMLNAQIQTLFGNKIYCTQASKDASTPSPTSAPVPTTASPTVSASTPSPNALITSSPSSSTSSSNGPTAAPGTASSTDAADAPATSVPRGGGSTPQATAAKSSALASLCPTFLVILLAALNCLLQ